MLLASWIVECNQFKWLSRWQLLFQESVKMVLWLKCWEMLNLESDHHFVRGISLFPPRRVCFRFGLSVCQRDYWKTTGLISLKLGGRVRHRPRKNPLSFGADPNCGYLALLFILFLIFLTFWIQFDVVFGVKKLSAATALSLKECQQMGSFFV